MGRGESENYNWQHMAAVAPKKMPEGYWAEFREEVRRAHKEAVVQPIENFSAGTSTDRLVEVLVAKAMDARAKIANPEDISRSKDKVLDELTTIIAAQSEVEPHRVNRHALAQAVNKAWSEQTYKRLGVRGVDLTEVDENHEEYDHAGMSAITDYYGKKMKEKKEKNY